MIQQRLKKLYKSSPWFVRKTAILFFSLIVDIWAGLKRVHFPKKYNSEWASRLEMLSGNLEKETVALCKKILKPGMNAVDIGAHIGYYTMLFSKLVGKNGQVFAFEPEPENFQLLAENTGKYRNVKIFQKAISDKSGPLWFYRSEGKTACHSLLPADFRNEKIEV
ncbi:MAG: FkbM family methyltransferase, partial [Patescibacteria group bacterium]